MSEQKPLTLEELRKSNGEKVVDVKTRRKYTVNLNVLGIGACVVYKGGYYLPIEIAAKEGFCKISKKCY